MFLLLLLFVVVVVVVVAVAVVVLVAIVVAGGEPNGVDNGPSLSNIFLRHVTLVLRLPLGGTWHARQTMFNVVSGGVARRPPQ